MLKKAAQIEVRGATTGRDRERFLSFPYAHYRETKHWVPPIRLLEKHLIDTKRNPFYLKSEIQPFVAVNTRGETVGRIAAIVNGMHLEKYGDATGFFGFFETIDDTETSAALLDAACDWLKERGLSAVRGPASPSMNDLSGLLVNGFESEPSFFMPYNFPYYESQLLAYGFMRAMTMHSFFIHKKFLKLERGLPALEAVYKHHPTLRVRSMNPKNIDEEVRLLVEIHNDAFAENWGHVPLSEAEFAGLAKLFKYFVDPDLVLFLEFEGKTVGFTVVLPNFNEAIRHLKSGRLFPFGWIELYLRSKLGSIRNVRSTLTGVKKEAWGRGFDAALFYEGASRGMNKHYEGCELSWVLDSNRVVVNSLDSLGAIRDKEYAMFEKRFA